MLSSTVRNNGTDRVTTYKNPILTSVMTFVNRNTALNQLDHSTNLVNSRALAARGQFYLVLLGTAPLLSS